MASCFRHFHPNPDKPEPNRFLARLRRGIKKSKAKTEKTEKQSTPQILRSTGV